MEQPVFPSTSGILPAPAGGTILPPQHRARRPPPSLMTMFPPEPGYPPQLSRRQAKKQARVLTHGERQEQQRPPLPGGVQKEPGKRGGFDASRIVDLKYPYNMYPKWDEERRRKLFHRIICIPPQFLTVGMCKKAIVLGEMIGKPVSAKFLARKEELEKEKEDRKEMHKQKRMQGIEEGYSMPSGSGRTPMEEQPYLEPPYEWYTANIEPENHIEPLDNGPFQSNFHSDRSNGYLPRPNSSKHGNSLISGAPSEISSKISTLYEKFCIKTEENQPSPWQMTPSVGAKPPPIKAPSRGNILRVPSPVDFGRNSAPERPSSVNEMIPPEEIAKTDRYTLEEPALKLATRVRFPITVQEIAAVSDIVLLCQLRDAPLVLKPFIHPTTRGLLRKLATHLGNGFQLMEISKTSTVTRPAKKGFNQAPRIVTNVWIQGIIKLLTLGEGVDIDPHVSTDWAYASCLASLVYMMIIPYQLVLAVQNAGEEYISLALYACKQRIRELIAVSRDPYYGQLVLHEGNINECSDSVKELWANFINRMRHMGMTHWEDNKIRVPSYWQPFPKNCVNGFYFECVADKQQFSWDGLVPNSYDIIPFDIEDFISSFSQSRFSCSAAESGLLPPEPFKNVNRSLLYQLKHAIPNLPASKFDPIVHLPFRDLLYKYGATFLSPMFTLFTVKYIGHRWGRRLYIKHQLIIEVDDIQKEHWKHVVSVSFEGIPYFFLGAKCAMDNFSSALFHCCSIVAQQLSTMMIIPRELCQLLESNSRHIVAAVIYGCRHRFAAFEALMRNPMFASLIVLESADLEFRNPLYHLAEYFYWRMRNTGWAYWMENRLIKVPMGLINLKNLPTDTFFQFQECFDQADWTQINSPETYFDNFDVRSLAPEDRFPAHWEGGGWTGPEAEYEEDEAPAPSSSSHPARHSHPSFKSSETKEFENALINEYRVPKCLLSTHECETVLQIIRCLAGMGMTVLQMNITTEKVPDAHNRYHCDLSWAGDLGWLLSAQYIDDRESALEYGAAWSLYKLLIRMGIVPPGLYKFVCNNEARLPYVISSLSPFIGLLESLLPTYRNHEDQLRARDYLIDEMHHLCVLEWFNRAISLPPELLPSLPETEQLPFIRTGTMDFREYEEWNRKSHMYHRKAEILDSRRGKKQQPGVKIGKTKYVPTQRERGRRREEERETMHEEPYGYDYGYGHGPSTSSAREEYVDPYGQDEYF